MLFNPTLKLKPKVPSVSENLNLNQNLNENLRSSLSGPKWKPSWVAPHFAAPAYIYIHICTHTFFLYNYICDGLVVLNMRLLILAALGVWSTPSIPAKAIDTTPASSKDIWRWAKTCDADILEQGMHVHEQKLFSCECRLQGLNTTVLEKMRGIKSLWKDRAWVPSQRRKGEIICAKRQGIWPSHRRRPFPGKEIMLHLTNPITIKE